MFRATMCPSSGETTVYLRHLVLVILCGWLSGMQGGIPDSHPHRITSTKCHINTVVSPDDGPVAAPKHVETDKYINILRSKNCAPSWFYLQKKKKVTIFGNAVSGFDSLPNTFYFLCFSIHPSMALQPLPGRGLPHKTPPFISIRTSSPPSSYPQHL